MRAVTYAMLALLLAGSSQSLSGEDTQLSDHNWQHPNEVSVAPEEIAFTPDYIGTTKNESVYVWVYSPDGPIFLFSIFHVDTFLFNRWGMYALVVDPDGESHWITATPRTRDMTYATDHLSVSDGMTSFEGRDGIYHLVCDFGGLQTDITLASRLPPWKPGTGRLDYTEDGSLYQMRFLVAPWAKASGTIQVDGKQFDISGHGYVSKTRFSNPLTRFAPYVHALKLYDNDDFLYLLQVTLNEAYENRTVPMLVFAHDNHWVFTGRDYEYTVESYSTAGELPYEYPTRMHIRYDKDGYVLDGVFTETRLLNVTDVFEELPEFVERMLLVVLSRPVYYRSIGTFSGTLTSPDGKTRELELTGPFEYTVVR